LACRSAEVEVQVKVEPDEGLRTEDGGRRTEDGEEEQVKVEVE
jgi:hypothetical protein